MLKPDITGMSGEGGESKDGTDQGRNSSKGVKTESRTNATPDGETKVEADGEEIGEGLERASATLFSGPGTSGEQACLMEDGRWRWR